MNSEQEEPATPPSPKRYARITGTKAVVLCGALAFLLCGLFPPGYCILSEGRQLNCGYNFIINDDNARIDLVRLGIEWLCVLVATGAAWVLVAKPRRLHTTTEK